MIGSSVTYLRFFFIETFAYQMYTLGHTPYKFVWILDVFLGMNVCDVYNSLTLTICAFSHLVTFVSCPTEASPSFFVIEVFDFWLIRVI